MPIYKEVDELLNAMDTWDKFGVSFGLFRLNKSNEKDYVPYVRYEDMVQAVTGAPHADVAPVIHAHWKKKSFNYASSTDTEAVYFLNYVCSKCDTTWKYSSHYCPNCGARMDEEVDNDKIC